MQQAKILTLSFAIAVSVIACAPASKKLDGYDVIADVSGLQLDDSLDPVLVYRRPGAPGFDAYSRFIVDDVQVSYTDPELPEISPEKVGEMQQYFRSALIKELRDAGFEVGTRSQPNTMRISLTVSDLQAPSAAANVTAAVIPFAMSVGAVTVEAVFEDAWSGETMAVAIERSQGSRGFNPSPWSTWSDVTASFDNWAKGIREAVEKAHGG